MPEIQKYNTKEKILAADEKYKHDPALVGMSSMTHYKYNNSTRTQMFTSHINQIVNIIEPEVPMVPTGAENITGRHSSGYKKLKGDCTVFRKVVKFEGLIDTPYVFNLFVFNHKKNRYEVYTREEVKDLSQDYGYKYNTEVIDGLKEGDEIKEGTVLYKSNSYDPYMNYRFGRNLNVGYTFDPRAGEDAAIISDYASVALTSVHSEWLEWRWNYNDIPMNVYGDPDDDDDYRPLPWIGEEIEGYITASRLQVNEQMLHDMTHKNLREIRDDRTIEYPGRGTVVDYDIFCNDDNIPDNSFNHQILQLLESQTEYWREIRRTCEEIVESGYDYDKNIDHLLKRSREFIDDNDNRRWNDGNSASGYLKFKIHIVEYNPLAEGGKFTARYGNKSVVSKVLPRWMMPFDSSGRVMDVLLNQPAISNRTTGFVPHEMYITWASDLTAQEIQKATTLHKKEKLLFEYIKAINERQYTKMYATYKELSTKEKKAYIDSAVEHGIITFVEDISEEDSIFYTLEKLESKFPYLKPATMYKYKWGQVYRIANKYRMGKMYFFPLKQTDRRAFSGRNTGAINMKGLPERSYKNKKHESAFSDTPIRFGEYETMNLLIGLDPDELSMFHALYRTSQEATHDLTKAQFMKKGFSRFKKHYKSRTAEIFSVLYKHLGLNLEFYDSDNSIMTLDDTRLRRYEYDGKTFLMTELEFRDMKLRDEMRTKILEEKVIMREDLLEKEIDRRIGESMPIVGKMRTNVIFDDLTDEDD